MKPRHTLILAAAAGAAATVRGQEIMQVSYSWSEVIAGTLTPVSSPNSILEPGEGARIGLNLFAARNGVNAIGQTTTYTPPPPPGSGTIRGIAAFIYNLIGDNDAPSANGSWTNRAISSILGTGAFIGNTLNNGSQLDSFGGSQFVAAGGTASGTNPITDAFRGVWTPFSYAARTVNFKAFESNPVGQHSAILVQYGTALADPTDPTSGYALYLTKYIQTNFGTGINITIAPAPATLPILALLAIPRRRPPSRRASAR